MFTNEQLCSIEERLKCPICRNFFSSPRMLLCQHTLCEHCIVDLATRQGSELNCPICGTQFALPEGGASALPKSILVVDMLDVLAVSKQRLQKEVDGLAMLEVSEDLEEESADRKRVCRAYLPHEEDARKRARCELANTDALENITTLPMQENGQTVESERAALGCEL